MRVLVTGATGFMAPHLLDRLVRDGHEAIALGHDAGRIPAGDSITPVVVDLASPIADDVLPAFDAVVHLAQANVPFPDGSRDVFRVNAVSTQELIELARRRGASRFVYASSGSVYGLGEGAVYEDDPRRGDDFYAVTKRAGELVVRAYGDHLGTAVLRFFAPYGPGQVNRLIPGLIARVSNGDAVTLREGGRPRMTPIYVDDAVEAIVRSLENEDHIVLNVAGDEVASIRDLAEKIGTVVGREPVFEDAGGEAPGDLVARNELLHGLLGEHPLVTLDDGLRRTVATTLRG
jgi:nucleoside-diphosphate-sugar epimerase